MRHKFNNPNEVFAILEKLGLLDELDEKVEAQKLEERKGLLRDRFILRSKRDTVMPRVGKEMGDATAMLKLADENVLKARQTMNAAAMRVYGASLTFSEDKLNSQIEAASPKFMQDAYDELGEMHEFVRGTTHSWREREPVGWNYRNIDMSNADQIAALMEMCKAGQAKIRELMYDIDTPIEEQRQYCAAIVANCVAMTHPQLKDDQLWLAQQEKKSKSKK